MPQSTAQSLWAVREVQGRGWVFSAQWTKAGGTIFAVLWEIFCMDYDPCPVRLVLSCKPGKGSLQDVLAPPQNGCDIHTHSRLELNTSSANSSWVQEEKWKVLSSLQTQTGFAYLALDIQSAVTLEVSLDWKQGSVKVEWLEVWSNTTFAVQGVLYQCTQRDSHSWLGWAILLLQVPGTGNQWSYRQETSLRNSQEKISPLRTEPAWELLVFAQLYKCTLWLGGSSD